MERARENQAMKRTATVGGQTVKPDRTVLALALGCLLMAVLMATMIRSAEAGQHLGSASLQTASDRPGHALLP